MKIAERLNNKHEILTLETLPKKFLEMKPKKLEKNSFFRLRTLLLLEESLEKAVAVPPSPERAAAVLPPPKRETHQRNPPFSS